MSEDAGSAHSQGETPMAGSPRSAKYVPGPFYTTGGCTACGASEAEAPELLAPLEGQNYDTCFVRQPATAAEVERACRAVEVCCAGAVRYGGQDPAILRRLARDSDCCDQAPA
jgi:hypothetical protein